MSQTKSIMDVATRESIMIKTYKEAYELMEKLASNHHQMVHDRTVRKYELGVLQMDALGILSSLIAPLN